MKVLLADDEPTVRKTLGDALRDAGYDVDTVGDGAEAFDLISKTKYDCVVSDIRMPGLSGMELLQRLKENSPATAVILITGHGTVESAVEAMRLGAADYVQKPFLNEDVVMRVAKIEQVTALKSENIRLRKQLAARRLSDVMVGASEAMRKVFDRIDLVADRDISVLITGESGTGKELVARALHDRSGRSSGPFVAVPCAALPESLLEDELFGHEKGAFTDARERRIGRFETAHTGTIFLDDIDDINLSVQVKLLRVLQERELTRVGGETAIKVDIRVVAATKADLKQLASQRRFREDLYYRLAELPINLPPLRERLDDVPLLVEHFISMHGGGRKYRVEPEALAAMSAYNWPGNVRELENSIKRAIALSGESELLPPEHLLPDSPAPPPTGGAAPATGAAPAPDLNSIVAAAEKEHIRLVLESVHGRRTEAAKLLGITRKTLWQKMKRYDLSG